MRVKVRSLRSDLAAVLREASRGAVTVVKYGEPIAVILSVEEFNRLRSAYTSIPKNGAQALAFRQ